LDNKNIISYFLGVGNNRHFLCFEAEIKSVHRKRPLSPCMCSYNFSTCAVGGGIPPPTAQVAIFYYGKTTETILHNLTASGTIVLCPIQTASLPFTQKHRNEEING